jgi:hypothetical protein
VQAGNLTSWYVENEMTNSSLIFPATALLQPPLDPPRNSIQLRATTVLSFALKEENQQMERAKPSIALLCQFHCFALLCQFLFFRRKDQNMVDLMVHPVRLWLAN